MALWGDIEKGIFCLKDYMKFTQLGIPYFCMLFFGEVGRGWCMFDKWSFLVNLNVTINVTPFGMRTLTGSSYLMSHFILVCSVALWLG